MPRIEVGHFETRSSLNELGTKGVGEAGAIPVLLFSLRRLRTALYDQKLEILEMPLSPNRLFELLHKEKSQEN